MNLVTPETLFDDLDIFALVDRMVRDYSHFFDRVILTDVLQRYGVTRRGLRVIQAMQSEGGTIDRGSLGRLVGLDERELQRALIDLIGRKLVITKVRSENTLKSVVSLTLAGIEVYSFAEDRILTVTSDPDIRMAITLSESERMELTTALIKLEGRVAILNRAMTRRETEDANQVAEAGK